MSRVQKFTNLTSKQQKFVDVFSGNVTAAATTAGYKQPHIVGKKVLQNKHVIAALKARQVRDELAKDQVAKENALLTFVTKAEIIDGQLRNIKRLEKIADELKENGELGAHAKACSAISGAWDKLADLCQHKVHLSADISKYFVGRSIEEQEFFCNHGYFPDSVESAKSGTDGDPGVASTGTGWPKVQ